MVGKDIDGYDDVKKIERIVQEIKESEQRFGNGLRQIIQVT